MNAKRNGLIDIVRFLGGFSIVAGHWYSVWPQVVKEQTMPDAFFRFFGIRLNAMVALFFVISGYYAAKSFSSLSEGRCDCSSWIFGRIRRLFPSCILSLLLFTILDIIFWRSTGSWWLGRKWTLSSMVLTSLGINVFSSASGNGINSPVWFVGALLFNTIVFALIASSGMRKETKAACFMGLFLLGLCCMDLDSGIPLIAQKVSRGYMSFFAGVLSGLYLKPKKDPGSFPLTEILALLLTGIVSGLSGWNATNGLAGDRIILYTLLVGPSLIRVGENEYLQRVLSHKITAVAGELSFDIYLFHMPVFVLIAIMFRNAVQYNDRRVFALAFLGILAFSAAVFAAAPQIESCFLRFLRKIGFGALQEE